MIEYTYGNIEEIKLSNMARSVWGKSDREDNELWLPLYVHMADSAEVAQYLWNEWVPQGTKNIIAQCLDGDRQLAKILYRFVAGVHDIGKATPIFQLKSWGFPYNDNNSLAWKPRKAGLIFREELQDKRHPSHPVAGQIILNNILHEQFGWESRQRFGDVCNPLSCIVGGHHGIPVSIGEIPVARYKENIELGWDAQFKDTWRCVQKELVQFVRDFVDLDDHRLSALSKFRLHPAAESVLTGLVIMADWIASNTQYFPLIPLISDDNRKTSFEAIEKEDYIQLSVLRSRCKAAWNKVSLTPYWDNIQQVKQDIAHICISSDRLLQEENLNQFFARRFTFPEGASARPIQKSAVLIAAGIDDPGIIVVEAPMGLGKTEAALAAAEILAGKTGRGGVCVALPTMATTDAMFSRVHSWLNRVPQGNNGNEKSLFLAHGKAELNEEFGGIVSQLSQSSLSHELTGFNNIDFDSIDSGHGVSEDAIASQWMQGRKKGVLANFLVCTVDQVLMAALTMKHLALRQLSFANKVVIIDECHAYDMYMQEYLKRSLEWLGAFGTPVVLLSATLPEKIRKELVSAYIQGKQTQLQYSRNLQKASRNNSDIEIEESEAYPRITYTSGLDISSIAVETGTMQNEVSVCLMSNSEQALQKRLERLLVDGGCAGVICDTVSRAQETAQLLGQVFGSENVILTHSRFIDIDRMSNETKLRALLGPNATVGNGKRPYKLIVVGTQVLEQSLDIDFDVLITDIAPVDLIMQRIGRVHRHQRGENQSDRPKLLRTAQCYVRGIEYIGQSEVRFARGVDAVYSGATLLEALSVMNLTKNNARANFSLPQDIATLVRLAYSEKVEAEIPEEWAASYQSCVSARLEEYSTKRERAKNCLLKSIESMERNNQNLVDWFAKANEIDDAADDDKGPRAVRDTQDTVEVVLLRHEKGNLALLPWVGSVQLGIRPGESFQNGAMISENLAKTIAQCSVRLPLAVCNYHNLDKLISELETRCDDITRYWQESKWLSGKLVVLLKEESTNVFVSQYNNFKLKYSERAGLEYNKFTC